MANRDTNPLIVCLAYPNGRTFDVKVWDNPNFRLPHFQYIKLRIERIHHIGLSHSSQLGHYALFFGQKIGSYCVGVVCVSGLNIRIFFCQIPTSMHLNNEYPKRKMRAHIFYVWDESGKSIFGKHISYCVSSPKASKPRGYEIITNPRSPGWKKIPEKRILKNCIHTARQHLCIKQAK